MPIPENTDDRVYENKVRSTTLKLLAYCRRENWSGYEPYDALNSRIFEKVPILDFKLFRLGLTQILKRSAINVRSLLLIPKTQNPKALGLFLSALLKLSKSGIAEADQLIDTIVDQQLALRSKDSEYWNWGYNFPWQTRSVLVPRWAPNLVCTVFVADSLLDLYEERKDTRYLEIAASSADYLVNKLYWTQGQHVGFSYPLPGLPQNRVHNATFLASALLLRVHHYTGNPKLLEPALHGARYAAAQQRNDGGWMYGELPSQQWIDNFHTGFNLCALRSIAKYGNTTEFDANLRKGLDFYLKHFFRSDGSVTYFHDRTYPFDTHSVAQAIITLIALKDLYPESLSLAKSVLDWAMQHMWDEREGFFYYRVHSYCTIKTSYMRWTQAWMLLALSTLLADLSAANETPMIAPSTLR